MKGRSPPSRFAYSRRNLYASTSPLDLHDGDPGAKEEFDALAEAARLGIAGAEAVRMGRFLVRFPGALVLSVDGFHELS